MLTYWPFTLKRNGNYHIQLLYLYLCFFQPLRRQKCRWTLLWYSDHKSGSARPRLGRPPWRKKRSSKDSNLRAYLRRKSARKVSRVLLNNQLKSRHASAELVANFRLQGYIRNNFQRSFNMSLESTSYFLTSHFEKSLLSESLVIINIYSSKQQPLESV